MKHTHMAIGMIPEDLVNLSVLMQFTPGQRPYTLTLIDKDGGSFEDAVFHGDTGEAFGYEPRPLDLDMRVFHGLSHRQPLVARLAQSLAGFGYFQWFNPVAMSSEARARYEAAAQ
ncbi:hypothetical protein GPA10_22430 [Streptomyces sp. p1417]|uniref:Uncharacterized protein n=1 Tax=Streptomyces typhae TaxID=2681492 RepID=A0A6L6X0Y9_9ACTN|nr:hypothetical protein [Streptomyces typhae]MVO87443.1 hypothetical protein [Streptomyces typhae]